MAKLKFTPKQNTDLETEDKGGKKIRLSSDNVFLAEGATTSPLHVSDINPLASEAFRLGATFKPESRQEGLMQQFALNQSTGEQATNMVKGGSKQFLAGFLDNFNYDIPDMVSLVQGKEQEYGNWLSDFTEELREDAENNPIYQDGASFSDPAYWMNQGKNLAFSVGLASGALLEQAALTTLTAGTFGAGSALQATALGAKIAKLGRVTKGVGGNILFGTGKGIHEGYINALETYKGTFDKFKELGFSDEDATKRAGQAAALGYKLEVGPLMALNALQFGTIGKYNPFKGKSVNLGYGGAVENITSKMFPGVKNKFAKGALDMGVNALSESAEEMIQTGVSKYAQYETVADAGYAFADLEMFDQEMTDSMVGGFLGGLMFGTMGKISDKLTSKRDKGEYGRKHDEFIAKAKQNSIEDLKLLAEASAQGNNRKMNFLRYKMSKQGVANAVFLDMANGKETAYEAHVGAMTDILDAVNSGNLEEYKKYGIETEEDINYVKENYPEYIQDAETFKAKFVSAHQKTGDVYASLNLADAEAARNFAATSIRKDQQAVSNVFNGDPVFESLSADAKRYVHAQAQKRALALKKISMSGKISEELGKEFDEINAEIDTLEMSAREKNIADSFDDQKAIEMLYSNLEMEDIIDKANSKIKYWSDPKNINKENKQRAEKKIDRAKTEEDVKKAEAELKKQGKVDKATQEKINSRKQEARVNDKMGNKAEDKANPATKTQAQKITNIVSGKEADVVEQDSLADDFMPMAADSVTDDARKGIKREVKNYYNSLKGDIADPTLEDLILDFMKNEGKDTTEKLFNLLAQAWEDNGYKKANTKALYTKYFEDTKVISGNIVALADIENEETIEADNKEVIEKAKRAKAKPTKLDNNNRPILSDSASIKTATPNLKLAHLSVPYARTIQENEDGTLSVIDEDVSNELNQSQRINSMALLDPSRFNPGAKAQIRIPDGVEDYFVTYWEDAITKGESMTFGEWMKKTGVEKGSEEWLAKVPMVVSDGKDDVAYLHDTEWYNPLNIGLKDDVEAQSEVIKEAQANLMNMRRAVIEGQGNIVITEKRPGTFLQFKTPVPLQEANPQAEIAIAGEDGRLYLNGDPTKPIQLEDESGNKKLFFTDNQYEPGYIYDVRQGTTADSKTAFRIKKGNISDESIETVKWLLKSYLLNQDADGNYATSAKAKNAAKQILDATGLDPRDMQDVGELLNAHIRLLNLSDVGNLSSPSAIQEYVSKSPKLKDGEPFISMEKGKVIIGTKGGSVSYLHPASVTDASKAKALPIFFSNLEKIMKAGFKANISKSFLAEQRNMPVFDDKGQMVSTKPYNQHAREGLMTNIKSFNVGTEENPVFATVVQPVVNFAPSEDAFSTFVDTGKVSEQAIKNIANKIIKGQELTKQELAMRQTAFEEVEAILNKEFENNQPTETAVEETTGLTVDEIKTLEQTKAFLLKQGASITDAEILAINEKLGIEEDLSPAPLTEEQVLEMREDLSGVEGISILQDYLITDYLFNEISGTLGERTSEEDLKKAFNDAYDQLIKPKKENTVKILNNLKQIKTEGLQGVVDRMELEMEVFDVLENNWSSFADKAYEKFEKYDITDEIENSYTKESVELNKQASVSALMKRFLRNVKQVDANGNVATGFLDIPLYVSFDTVDSTMRSVLASPIETEVDFDIMMLRLEENKKNQKWLPQVIERLKAAPEQVKNQFVYNYQGHSLSMKFLMYSENRSGGHDLKVYDTNSNEVTRNIRQTWNNNIKGDAGQNILAIRDGSYVVNKDRAAALLEDFNKFSEDIQAGNPVSNETLKTWLKNFGIELSDETLNDLKSNPMVVVTKEVKTALPFQQLFRKSNNSSGLFGKLADYLERVSTSNETLEIEENDKNHPFSDMSGILNTLSRIESKYAKYATVHSFRDGDKNIFAYTNSKHGTDVTNKLKFDDEFRAQLGEKDFNGGSLLLDILNTNEAAREKFSIDHVGITSNKEMGSKPYGDNTITKASPTDHEHVKIGMFQDMKQGELKHFVNDTKTIETRMARMFLPTMSDKSQMLDLLLPVLDLKMKNFNEEDGTINDSVLQVAYSQLVTPEVNRIANRKETDIKGYDIGSGLFLMVPAMNSLMYDGERVIQLMAKDPEKYNAAWFQNNMAPEAKAVLRQFLESNVSKKISEWKEIGVVEGTEDAVTKINLLDSTYMGKFNQDMTKNVKMAATDYVVNSMITNANVFMTMAGDPAIYAKGDMKQYFQNGDVFLPKEEHGEAAYAKMAKDALGVNIGKRLALMLTPGNKIANSSNQNYLQLFMEDPIDFSPNMLALAELFYDNTQKLKDGLNLLSTETDTAKRAEMIKVLKNAYPMVADYFDMEIADAQEYTTAKEHIDVLWGKGAIDDKTYADINSKLERQYAAEEKGEMIDPKDYLSRRELSFVLQPMKPVYTGFINDKKNNVMRMMYVKSSSFALIPQLTKGTELDKMRRLMEQIEKKKGKNVRASYQSANKVGALNNPIKAFTNDGTFNPDLTPEKAMASTLLLDRNNFRIQQEVPYKTASKKEERNKLGTQPMKLLFGDGMLSLIDNKVFNQYNDSFNELLIGRRKALLKRLGVDENGQPLDVEETANRLQRMLIEEATKRGYPKQDIEALKLEPVYDSNGDMINISFAIPLWLSPNSNKYESLLNSVVTNQLVNLQMPGSSYVVGSEAGFRMQAELNNDIEMSNIVYTDKWEGQLKPAEIVDGELKKAQVLVTSKFRDKKGKLIKLINEDGTPNPFYVERKENGMLGLKDDKIAEELMNFSTYRIPASGHVSMSQVEIVGFLPEEAGDLMIMPMNFITQMGQDFDIDKQYSVNLNTYMDEEGNLRAYDEEALESDLEMFNKELGLNKGVDALFETLFGDQVTEDFTNGSISVEEKIEKTRAKLMEKIYENRIADSFAQVLSSPDPQVQKKIQKVLSMDFAKSQAVLISEELTEAIRDNNFSFLSDMYQKEKMELGASGKTAIGVYSNYVTFHSLSNQAQVKKQPRLQTITEDGMNNYQLTLGKFTANGILGNETTLDGNRSVAEVFAERQNTATDNEKEQIMGRVNVNDTTINVDSLLTALGFDQDVVEIDGKQTPMSIPYLLLSQPIVRDYVRLMAIKNSNVAEYNPELAQEVMNEVKAKYGEADAAERNLLTGQALFNSLKEPSDAIQLAVIEVFDEVNKMAEKVQQLQTMLSINRSGLGKSFFETIEKHDQLGDITVNNSGEVRHKKFKQIANIDAYIGEIRKVNSEDQINDAREEGFSIAKNVAIKAETPVGRMLTEAVITGYNLWSNYFPYDQSAIKLASDNIIKITAGEEVSDRKSTELKMEIFKEMKKYFASSNKLGLFQEDPMAERARLYFDTETNDSLANYLRKLKDTEDFRELVTNNKLMSRFQLEVNKNGHPSLIKFDNSRGENFDEEYMYTALIELVDENKALPQFNGKEYTTRDLAQDLVAYAYLEGGVQEAVQFTKYIPVSFLNAVGFGDTVRTWASTSNASRNHFSAMLANQENNMGRFVLQYFRNNPARLPKVTENDITEQSFVQNGKILSNLTSFQLKEDVEVDSPIIAIYNPKLPKGEHKFQVYLRGKNGEYKKIPAAGIFGMSEYALKQSNPKSLIYGDTLIESAPQDNPDPVGVASSNDVFGVLDSDLTSVVTNIGEESGVGHLAPLAKAIKGLIDPETKLNVVNDKKFKGRFTRSKNTITIDKSLLDDPYLLAETIMHETIHSLTANYVQEYVHNNGANKVEQIPASIQNLNLLYSEVVRAIGEDKVKEIAQKHKAGEKLSEDEIKYGYAGYNIHEMMAMTLTSSDFQAAMAEVEYKSSGKSLLEKFMEIINDMLRTILGDSYNANSLSANIIATTLQIAEEQAQKKGITNSNAEAEALINDPIFKGKAAPDIVDNDNPFDVDTENSVDLSIFANPFKC